MTWKPDAERLANNKLSRKKITTTLGTVGASQTVNLLTGVLNVIVLSRWLEPAGRGTFVFLTLIAQFILLLLEFGLPNTITTFLLRQEYGFQTVFSNALFLALLRVCLCSFVAVITWLMWPKYNELGGQALLLVCLICAVDTLLMLAKTVLFTVGDMGRWLIIDAGIAVSLFTAIMLSWVFAVSNSPLYALLLYVFTRFIGMGVAFLFAGRYVMIRTAINGVIIRQIMRFSLKNVLNNVVWSVGNRADLYVVSAMMSPAMLGIYSVATGMADKMQSVLMAIPQGLYPSQAVAQDDGGRVENITARAVRLSLAIGIAAAVFVGIVSPFAVPFLFGAEYASAAVPLIVLSANSVFFIPFHLFGGYMTGRKMQPQISAAFGAIMVLINVAGNLLLIPILGILGAAFANLASTIVVLVLFAAFFARIAHIIPRDLFLVTYEDVYTLGQMLGRFLHLGRSYLARRFVRAARD
jgi:O-antigen/teichoic acid export membrane protein